MNSLPNRKRRMAKHTTEPNICIVSSLGVCVLKERGRKYTCNCEWFLLVASLEWDPTLKRRIKGPCIVVSRYVSHQVKSSFRKRSEIFVPTSEVHLLRQKQEILFFTQGRSSCHKSETRQGNMGRKRLECNNCFKNARTFFWWMWCTLTAIVWSIYPSLTMSQRVLWHT